MMKKIYKKLPHQVLYLTVKLNYLWVGRFKLFNVDSIAVDSDRDLNFQQISSNTSINFNIWSRDDNLKEGGEGF